MKYITVVLMAALILSGCGKETPPIELEVIASATSEQLKQQSDGRFLRVGTVKYNDENDIYHAEIYYTKEDEEKRYVMPLQHVFIPDQQLYGYHGRFPLELIKEEVDVYDRYIPVTVDEMMKK